MCLSKESLLISLFFSVRLPIICTDLTTILKCLQNFIIVMGNRFSAGLHASSVVLQSVNNTYNCMMVLNSVAFFFSCLKTCFLICFIMSMLWADIVQALSDTVNLLPSEPKNCWICSPVAFLKWQHDKLTKLYVLLTFNSAQVRCSLRKTARLYIYCNVYRWNYSIL